MKASLRASKRLDKLIKGSPNLLPFKNPLSAQPIWHVLDAKGCRVGHLAVQIARLLLGKHKPIYNPLMDCGDYVVVKNVEKVIFTGDKWKQKLYRWHTGYPGGLKEVKAKDRLMKHPDMILRRAVYGMLPKTRLRRVRLRKLRLYVGPHTPHDTQVTSGYHYKVVHRQRTSQQRELSVAHVKEMLKDAEAYLQQIGGTTVSIELEQRDPPAGVPTWTLEKEEGTKEPTLTSKRARRMHRIARLQKLVTEIQSKAGREKGKRESWP